MGAGKNKAHRKKRISKHVLKSQEKQSDNQEDDTAQSPPPTTTPKKSKKNKIKDPTDAVSYLSAWRHRDEAGVWKFNKNTQSWLVRHMYDVSMVNKATFEILMEYLAAGGEGVRSRLLDDATRRALRYKEYEKSQDDNDESKKDGEEAGRQKEEEVDNNNMSTEENETARWAALSDHDKRKEYKRARKILEALKTE